MSIKITALMGLTLSVVVLFGFFAVYFILGLNTTPRDQVVTKEFEMDNQPAHIILHFKSTDGAFVAGRSIHVDGLLYYTTKTNPHETFSLYFPNTIIPPEYDKLNDVTFWNSLKNTGALVLPADLIFENSYDFSGIPPIVDFNTVWTQNGVQNGTIIVHDSSTIKKIPLENIIDIEQPDVLQNTRTNNLVLGLTFYGVILAFVTIAPNFDKFRKR